MRKIDKPLYVHLGEQLKQARLKKGYSLRLVADMVGKNKTTIKRYEDAKVRVDMDTLERLCTVLDVKPSAMYFSTGDSVVESISLNPNVNQESPPIEVEDKGTKRRRISKQLFDKFVRLNANTQKIILLMMKYSDEEIDEILNDIS